jgi:hypothetical protein
MWRLLAPLLEGALGAALADEEAKIWLGPERIGWLEGLRRDLDDECHQKGW